MIQVPIFLGLATGFLGSLFGWQINLVALHRGLPGGRRATFLVGCGAAFADVLFLAAAFSGTRSLSAHHEWWNVIKWLGIITILIVAIKILLLPPKEQTILKAEKWGGTRNFILGFLLVIVNPGVFFLWVGVASFIVAYFPPLDGFTGHLLFFISFFSGCLIWFAILTGIFLGHVEKWEREKLYVISKISAFALLLAAAFLVFKQF